jgi:aminoglycoside/choline kinase family phosphotransferase
MAYQSQKPNISLFIKTFLSDVIGYKGEPVFIPLYSDGSQRQFHRFGDSKGLHTFILVENPPRTKVLSKENISYLKIGKHLFQKGLPVPEIYRFDLDQGLFILEDFGDHLIQDEILEGKTRTKIYKKVIELLIKMQFDALNDFDTNWCYQTKQFDRYCMRVFESNYFKDAYLINYLGLKKDWPELEEPFEYLAQQAESAGMNSFLHRDFQSRNIMITPKGLGVIDWQGGRLGPFPYDLASLLIDPYVCLSHDEQVYLFEYYVDCLHIQGAEYIEIIKRYYPYLAIQRNLQILGAYAFLSKVQGKSFFEQYIPPSLNSLIYLLKQLNNPKLNPLLDVVLKVIEAN